LLPTLNEHSGERFSLIDLVLIAISFGIFTGLIEGAGLMLFQRLNWASWGPMIHVSTPILWISPLCDAILFSILTIVVSLSGRFLPRLRTTTVLMFLLSGLAAYDFLTLTARLYRWSCFLLALGVGVAFTRWASAREDSVLRFARRTVIFAAALWCVAFIAVRGGSWLKEKRQLAGLHQASPEAPNVLVIVVDTLRADHLASYGYARTTSPNIDRLAQQGTLFENAISTCSWSLPSHVSLVTGLYQFQHGETNVQPMKVFASNEPSFRGALTLGEAFERRGYRTGAFSANRTWFSHDLGFARGFVHFQDYFHSPADMWVRTLFGREFSRIYLSRSDHSKPKRLLRWLGFDSLLDLDDEGVGANGGAPGVRKRASEVNREVLQWVDQDRRPFLVFLNYFDVHEPYGGPYRYPQPWPQKSPIDQYDDGVKYVDDSIGMLMSDLEKRGLVTNTIVVITSDHGEGLWQHGLPTHGEALYREQIHVPLIFWYPGHVPGGRRVSANVTNAAIPATLMTIVEADENQFQGPALNALWEQSGGAPPWPNPLSELAQDKYLPKQNRQPETKVPTASTGSMQSLIEGKWQLIEHSKSGAQLYDWSKDPGEVNEQSQSSEGRDIVGRLSNHLREMVSGGPVVGRK
jgi:arylsulfatase A-like enzyme